MGFFSPADNFQYEAGRSHARYGIFLDPGKHSGIPNLDEQILGGV